jgi:hypothetical protein
MAQLLRFIATGLLAVSCFAADGPMWTTQPPIVNPSQYTVSGTVSLPYASVTEPFLTHVDGVHNMQVWGSAVAEGEGGGGSASGGARQRAAACVPGLCGRRAVETERDGAASWQATVATIDTLGAIECWGQAGLLGWAGGQSCCLPVPSALLATMGCPALVGGCCAAVAVPKAESAHVQPPPPHPIPIRRPYRLPQRIEYYGGMDVFIPRGDLNTLYQVNAVFNSSRCFSTPGVRVLFSTPPPPHTRTPRLSTRVVDCGPDVRVLHVVVCAPLCPCLHTCACCFLLW